VALRQVKDRGRAMRRTGGMQVPGRFLRTALAALLLAAGASQCRAAAAAPTGMASQPGARGRGPEESDMLGLAGRTAPPVLEAIGRRAYVLAPDAACQGMADEIAALDAVLGPDIDQEAPEDTAHKAGRMATGAVRGLIRYRWALRWVVRADKRDSAFQEAVLGGVARRAFLKGVRLERGCPAPPAVATDAPH
jgi:hypothetical protein